MTKEIYLIARGNSTLLIENCPEDRILSEAKAGLKRFEQVGFVDLKGEIPSLYMMGGELSINGTLAFATKLKGRGVLKTSGLRDTVQYYQNKGETCIKINLPFQTYPNRLGTIVTFEGIGYLCTERLAGAYEAILRDLCNQYNLPAFGLAMFRGDYLEPYVYVKSTDSLVVETSCGSGSIAVSIVSGRSIITQSTGQRIFVTNSANNEFTVSAKVVKMKV